MVVQPLKGDCDAPVCLRSCSNVIFFPTPFSFLIFWLRCFCVRFYRTSCTDAICRRYTSGLVFNDETTNHETNHRQHAQTDVKTSLTLLLLLPSTLSPFATREKLSKFSFDVGILQPISIPSTVAIFICALPSWLVATAA